jgi:hypothetical protein
MQTTFLLLFSLFSFASFLSLSSPLNEEEIQLIIFRSFSVRFHFPSFTVEDRQKSLEQFEHDRKAKQEGQIVKRFDQWNERERLRSITSQSTESSGVNLEKQRRFSIERFVYLIRIPDAIFVSNSSERALRGSTATQFGVKFTIGAQQSIRKRLVDTIGQQLDQFESESYEHSASSIAQQLLVQQFEQQRDQQQHVLERQPFAYHKSKQYDESSTSASSDA